MDILKHSELSVYKFGGNIDDYFEIHKFIDSSKLFYFNVKHRSILHHTFGIELCTQIFGDRIINSEGDNRLVRDIAAEHIKEDLNGRIPTLKEWFEDNPNLMDTPPILQEITDPILQKFVSHPFLNSGLTSSYVITFSDFGISLAERLLGLDKALLLRNYIEPKYTIKSILKNFRFKHRWQYTPDMKQLDVLKKAN